MVAVVEVDLVAAEAVGAAEEDLVVAGVALLEADVVVDAVEEEELLVEDAAVAEEVAVDAEVEREWAEESPSSSSRIVTKASSSPEERKTLWSPKTCVREKPFTERREFPSTPKLMTEERLNTEFGIHSVPSWPLLFLVVSMPSTCPRGQRSSIWGPLREPVCRTCPILLDL